MNFIKRVLEIHNNYTFKKVHLISQKFIYKNKKF